MPIHDRRPVANWQARPGIGTFPNVKLELDGTAVILLITTGDHTGHLEHKLFLDPGQTRALRDKLNHWLEWSAQERARSLQPPEDAP